MIILDRYRDRYSLFHLCNGLSFYRHTEEWLCCSLETQLLEILATVDLISKHLTFSYMVPIDTKRNSLMDSPVYDLEYNSVIWFGII